MSKKSRVNPEPVAYTPSPAGADQPDHWVVIEDRRVCVNGAITAVRQGKIVRDPTMARQFIDQGVKLEARLAQKAADSA